MMRPQSNAMMMALTGLMLIPAFRSEGAEARTRVSLAYRAGINMSVDFKSKGGLPAIVEPQGATFLGEEWNYINGYALHDASGSSTESSYWGHQALDPSKLPTLSGGTMVPYDPGLVNLSRYVANSTDSSEDEISQGAELTISRLFGSLDLGHWGFLAGFGYSGISSRSDFSTPIRLRTDQFEVPGAVVVPSLGYEGSPQGTVVGGPIEPLILLAPANRQTTALPNSTWSSRRSFEADLYEFRLGPYVELPLSRRLSVNLNAGVTLAVLRSDLAVNQAVQVGDLAVLTPMVRGSASETDLLLGGYGSVQLWYSLSYRWSLFGGMQYQYLQSSTIGFGGTTARMDLGQTIYMTLGVGFAF